MSCTQLLPGLGKSSTRAIGHRQIARDFTVCRSSLATLTRLVIGLVIMALIVIGLTNPSGAQTTPSPHKPNGIPTGFARCLDDWDPGTHMTKKEWSGACQRLLIERGDYLPNQRR